MPPNAELSRAATGERLGADLAECLRSRRSDMVGLNELLGDFINEAFHAESAKPSQ